MRWIRLGLILIIGVPSVADPAELIYPFQYGGWDGGAYRIENTNVFSHCSITAEYGSGITLGFGITSQYDLSLVLANRAWHLGNGNRYRVNIRVDGTDLSSYEAEAFDNSIIIVNFGKDDDVLELLKGGKILTVEAAQENFRFNLTDARGALLKVKACVDLGLALAPGGSENPVGPVGNPFAPRGPSTGPGSDTGIDRDMVEYILLTAGITDPQFLSPAELRDLPNVAQAWIAGGIFGFVFQARRETDTVAAQMGDLLATIGEDCDGDFASAFRRTETFGGYALKKGFAACREAGGATTTYITAIFGDELVTVFGHMARDGVEETARRSNNAVMSALSAILR